MNNPRIILASGSTARKTMLENCGLKFETIPADIDEEQFQREITDPAKLAEKLAQEKALHVARQHPDALVIGSDQILECEGKILSKSKTKEEAIEKLKFLSGKTHILISAVSLAKQLPSESSPQILFSNSDCVKLTMRPWNEEFMRTYTDKAGDILTQCVGGYAIESHGAWLFEKIEGDTFTILGMPLIPLLNELRTNHGVIFA